MAYIHIVPLCHIILHNILKSSPTALIAPVAVKTLLRPTQKGIRIFAENIIERKVHVRIG